MTLKGPGPIIVGNQTHDGEWYVDGGYLVLVTETAKGRKAKGFPLRDAGMIQFDLPAKDSELPK